MSDDFEETYSESFSQLYKRIDLGGSVAAFELSILEVPRPLLLLFAAHVALAEVHNGGFLQLFWNSTGVLVPEAIEGLLAFELHETAGLFTSASKLLGSAYPRDRDLRWDSILEASTLSGAEMEEVFRTVPSYYLGFEHATAMLPWRMMSAMALELARTENGGFQARAVSFLERYRLTGE